MLICVVTVPVCSAQTARSKPKPKHPTASELLDKYAENLSKRQSYIAKTESSVVGSKTYTRGIRDNRVKYNAGELRFDGDRVSSRYHMWGHINGELHLKKDVGPYYSKLWDGEDYYQYKLSNLPNQPRPYGAAIITRGKEKSNEKFNRSIMTVRIHSCGPLMGFFEYDAERVDKILRQADSIFVRKKLEKINGSNCYVIQAKTRRGKYTLWIDPEHGYNIAKAHNIKQAGDLTFSTDTLLEDKARILYYIKDVRFEKIDGVWVPVEADMGNSRIVKDGRFYISSRMHVKITDIVLNPDHDALGSFLPDDILDGAEVRVKQDLNMAYTWQDGKPVEDCLRR